VIEGRPCHSTSGATLPPVCTTCTSATAARCLLEVVGKDAVANARRVARSRHLEGHEPAIVADHRIGHIVTRILVEVSQALPGLLAVEGELHAP
jgi:hypothetical protein